MEGGQNRVPIIGGKGPSRIGGLKRDRGAQIRGPLFWKEGKSEIRGPLIGEGVARALAYGETEG